MALSRTSTLALSTLAIIALACAPSAGAATKKVVPKYTMALSGVLTADLSEQSREEVDNFRCKGTVDYSASSHANFAFSYKSKSKQAFALPKKGFDSTVIAQISNAAASRKSTQTSNVQPTQNGTPEDCASYTSSEFTTQCFPNKTFILGVDELAGGGALTIQNDGEGPDDVFYVENSEGERFDCPAELGGFLNSHEVETKLTVKLIKKLKVGKSISASGSVDHQRSYGNGTAVYGGNYKLTFKRVK